MHRESEKTWLDDKKNHPTFATAKGKERSLSKGLYRNMQKIRQVLDQNSWLRNASHIFLFLFFVLSRGQNKKKKNSSALRGLVRTGGWEGRGWIATCCSRR